MKVENANNLFHYSKTAGIAHGRGQSTAAKVFQSPIPVGTGNHAFSELTETGEVKAADGQNSPPVASVASDPQAGQGLDGMSRALDRLQHDLDKKPDNPGLVRALEMVQRNQQRQSIETQA